MSRYNILPLPHGERIPEGFELIEAYTKDDVVVIPMELGGLDNDHDCDWEGCATFGYVLRISPQQKYLLERSAEKWDHHNDTLKMLVKSIQEKIVISNNDFCKYNSGGVADSAEAWGGFTAGLRWVLSKIEVEDQIVPIEGHSKL